VLLPDPTDPLMDDLLDKPQLVRAVLTYIGNQIRYAHDVPGDEVEEVQQAAEGGNSEGSSKRDEVFIFHCNSQQYSIIKKYNSKSKPEICNLKIFFIRKHLFGLH
jgi:hypothetical protein